MRRSAKKKGFVDGNQADMRIVAGFLNPLPKQPTMTADRVHSEIMNLEVHRYDVRGKGSDYGNGYRLGHKVARHAAAEIAMREIAALEAENARLREAVEAVLNWYNRDGSVGGACDPMEQLTAAAERGRG